MTDYEDKYMSGNPLARWLLGRFLDAVFSEIERLAPQSILDFGCGEGLLWRAMQRRGLSPEIPVLGVDVREDAIRKATLNAPAYAFRTASMERIGAEKARYDLVMACEVLEHLSDPAPAIASLARLSSRSVLLTIPHEPWFHLLKFIRGRGPFLLARDVEHVNHWSARSFRRVASRYVAVERVRVVFPWILLTGRCVGTAGTDALDAPCAMTANDREGLA